MRLTTARLSFHYLFFCCLKIILAEGHLLQDNYLVIPIWLRDVETVGVFGAVDEKLFRILAILKCENPWIVFVG
jgi:hypothetical protein